MARRSTRGAARRLVSLVVLLLGTTALAACGNDQLTDGVTDSTFVAMMADLERVERAPGLDDPARVAARTAALQRRGLTQAQLERAAAALADDPARAVALYRAIEVKASGDTTPSRDSTAGSAVLRRR